MPRAFTSREKQAIRQALIDAAASEIGRVGFRRLSIDAVVSAAHISKGAFYLFYRSKEMLIVDVLRHVQDAARKEATALMSRDAGARAGGVARRLLEGLFLVFTKYPIFVELSKPDSLVELVRGLPPDVLNEESRSDESFFRSLFEELVKEKHIRKIDIDVLCGLPRMVLALELNKGMIGPDRYDALKELFISGLARELI
jgi:AcrR family transcriptional regulator